MKKQQQYRNWLCAALLVSLPFTGYAAEYQLDDIVVTGVRVHEAPISEHNEVPGGQVARTADYGVLGNRDTMTTPFNATTFTDKTITDIQASNITDVIAMDASTNNQTLSGASQAWAIRGFRAQQQDVSFNGLHGIAPRFYTGVEGIDRVEVLKGASALLYGMSPNGSVGGNVNYVPKRAKQGENQNSIKFTYGDGKQFGQQIDLGARTADNKWGVHFTGYHTNGSTSFKDEKINTNSAFLGVDRQGSHSRFYLDAGYVYNNIENPQYRLQFSGITNTKIQDNYIGQNGLPKADHNAKYGLPDTYRHVTEKFGVARYEYDFSKHLTGFAALGMRETKMDYVYNDFRYQAKGNAQYRLHNNNHINKAISAEAGLKGRFQTGSVKHEVTGVATRLAWKRHMTNETGEWTAMNKLTANTVSNYDHSYGWGAALNDSNLLTGVALTDVISTKDDKWTFVVGGRYQHIKQNVNTSGKTYKEHAFSPAFAVVHKLNDKTSVYANYMQGLTAGDLVDNNYANDGEVLAPYKTKQFEVGTKFNTGKYLTTVSAFQMEQAGTLVETRNGREYLTSGGKVRNRGLEVSVAGEPREGTRVMGSVMFLTSKYHKSLASYEGNDVMGTPRWQAVARVEQDIKSVEGLSVNLRANYQGPSYIDQWNTYKVGGRVTWDLGARYEFKGFGGHPMTLRADVYNVFNKDYWNAMSNNPAVYVGKGRTAVVSLETKF
ncbi:MAG: TonB-dependent receptor [Veillonella sp.]|nr:TonB-dependent receptor [Veillonella sp.]